MPTLLGLCDVDIPETVQGRDLSAALNESPAPGREQVMIACYHPFGQWWSGNGGRCYRGLRTERYTYVETLDGPWLWFDNRADPHQQRNIIGENPQLRAQLSAQLRQELQDQNDAFRPGMDYIHQWGYEVDEGGTIPVG